MNVDTTVNTQKSPRSSKVNVFRARTERQASIAPPRGVPIDQATPSPSLSPCTHTSPSVAMTGDPLEPGAAARGRLPPQQAMPQHLSLPPQALTREDGRLVGTPQLLESSRVTLATDPRSPPVPSPSVFVDARGEIHNVRVGALHAAEGRENADHSKGGEACPLSLRRTRYNILFTRAGAMRSGDLHRASQHDFVLDGQVRVRVLQPDGSTSIHEYGPHSYVRIPPYTPHIFEFVQDTVLAEWWDTDEFCAWYYRPYREWVEKSVPTATATNPKPGRLVQYTVRTGTVPFFLS
jgi:hypothetical protein